MWYRGRYGYVVDTRYILIYSRTVWCSSIKELRKSSVSNVTFLKFKYMGGKKKKKKKKFKEALQSLFYSTLSRFGDVPFVLPVMPKDCKAVRNEANANDVLTLTKWWGIFCLTDSFDFHSSNLFSNIKANISIFISFKMKGSLIRFLYL